MKNVKKIIFSIVFLLVGTICVFFLPNKESVSADSCTVRFNYNVASLSEKLPKEIRDLYLYNQSVSVTRGDTVSCPVDTSAIQPYYNLEWQVVNGYDLVTVDLSTFVIDGSITLNAKWTPVSYCIYYNFSEEEKREIGNLKLYEIYNFESPQINFYIPVRNNYVFGDWYKDINLTELYINRPAGSIGDVYLYPKWLPIEYTITYHTDANNVDNILTYTYNSTDFVLKNPVKEGHIFKGWYLDKELKKECKAITSDMSGNIDLYPKWEPVTFTVTYVMPDGSHQVVYCEYGKTADLPKIDKSFFEIIRTSVPRNNIKEDTTILIKKVNIWYVYFLSILLIVSVVVSIIIIYLRRLKKLKRLRIMYQSNYKK